MPDEAPLVDGGAGLVPQGDGWFVVNAADAGWMAHDTFGARCNFEADGRLVNGRPELHVQQHLQLGIRLQVLEPGKPGAMYHRESNQEDFLVLSGECLLIVEGEERHLSCVGSRALSSRHDACLRGRGRRSVRDPHGRARTADGTILYPRDEVALRHGTGVETDTEDPRAAYAPFGHSRPGRPDAWDELPWSG